MDIKLKHRLVGACVILALAVFFLPLILDSEKYRSEIETQIPSNSTLQSEEKEEPETSSQGALTINLDEDEPEKAITEEVKPEQKPAESSQKKKSVDEVPAKTPETDDTSTESELQKQESGDTAETKAEAKNSEVGASSEQTVEETKKTKDTAARTKNSRTNEKQEADAGSVVETEKEAVVQKEPAPEKKPASNKNTPQFDEQAWVIQIGSFSNKDNATKLVSELRTQGYRAYERISGEYSRVYVGPYPDKEAADGRQKGLEAIIGTPVKIIEFDAQAH